MKILNMILAIAYAISGRDLALEEFDRWARTASTEELSEKLEANRQNWIKTGDYGPTEPILKREMTKRLTEEWEHSPHRNTDKNYYWTDENRWE